jgi:hypothetical protein
MKMISILAESFIHAITALSNVDPEKKGCQGRSNPSHTAWIASGGKNDDLK